MTQSLPESFWDRVSHLLNEITWWDISAYQRLSENFISKYADKVREHKYFVDWNLISCYQKLSEPFIEKYKNLVNWNYIFIWQDLSDEFIEKHIHRVNLNFVANYRKFSPEFLKKHNIKRSKHNWLYKENEKKMKAIRACKQFEMIDDYIIAYLPIGKLLYDFDYDIYEVGKVYEIPCNANTKEETNDFPGFLLYGHKTNIRFYESKRIYKVKVHIDDVRSLTPNNILRCCKIEILEKVK